MSEYSLVSELSSETNANGTDPPPTEPEAFTFRPTRYNIPQYEKITTHNNLIRYSKAYVDRVVAYYDLNIDESHLTEWEVTDRAKRRAAAVRTPDLSSLGVAVTTGVSDPDWDVIREEYNDMIQEKMDGFSDVKDVHIVLTWSAYEAFTEAEWRALLRHEAVHIEHYHTYGVSDHGESFTRRAAELDAPQHCPQFTEYTFKFVCTECGGDAGGRYRTCDAVESARRQDGEWVSDCCGAAITIEN